MSDITVANVIRALRDDADPRSGWLKAGRTGRVIEPREELFLQEPEALRVRSVWIRVPINGRVWVSGWTQNGLHFSRWFGPLGGWRIRRAVRAWHARRHVETWRARRNLSPEAR